MIKYFNYWYICNEMKKDSHLLIAGTVGSGKSVLLNSFLWTLSAFPVPEVGWWLVDLKRGCELGQWAQLPHFRGGAFYPDEVLPLLDKVTSEMDRRFKEMKKKGLRKSDEKDLYLIIDETAETLCIRGVEDKLLSIMRLSRATNIHVVLATQAPNRSKNGGLTAGICQTITSAVALRCRSAIESRQVIGIAGAEKLPRYGFGFWWSAEGIQKIEIPYTSDEDIEKRIEDWK